MFERPHHDNWTWWPPEDQWRKKDSGHQRRATETKGRHSHSTIDHGAVFAVSNTFLKMLEPGDKGSERLLPLCLHTFVGLGCASHPLIPQRWLRLQPFTNMLQDQTATRETSLLQTFREATHWQKQEAKFREAWGFIKSLEDDLSAGHQCNTAFRSLTKLSRWRDGWNTSQGSSSERRLLSPQQWMPLPIMEEWEATPTLEEIGKAINSLTNGKAPGNDGISQT